MSKAKTDKERVKDLERDNVYLRHEVDRLMRWCLKYEKELGARPCTAQT